MSRVYDFGLGGQFPDSSTKFFISLQLERRDLVSQPILRWMKISNGSGAIFFYRFLIDDPPAPEARRTMPSMAAPWP